MGCRAISCLFLIVLSSCTKLEPAIGSNAYQKDLDVNRSLWTSKSITHYRFDYMLGAFSANAGIWYTVEVDQNQITSIVIKDTQVAVNPVDLLWIKTFDGNFTNVQGAINAKVNSMKVTYDKDFGFVTYFYVDESATIADDETSITVTNFAIL